MFERRMLTFNPGSDQHCNETATCTDVRASQGPASLIVIDPDGNPVLIDQHR